MIRYICEKFEHVEYLQNNNYTKNKITDYLFGGELDSNFLVIIINEDDTFNLCDLTELCENCNEKCYTPSELKETPIYVKQIIRKQKLERIVK